MMEAVASPLMRGGAGWLGWARLCGVLPLVSLTVMVWALRLRGCWRMRARCARRG